MSEAPHLITEQDGAILIATLNRPEKLNSLSAQTLALFEESLHQFRDSADIKVMLIRATGRYFSAGADLHGGGDGDMADVLRTGSSIRELHRLKLCGMHRIYDEMEHIEKPIVVAHNATCIGGGLEMSLSCDFRLAASSATYAFPEGTFGVLPASNGVSRLTRIVGTHWARYLVMANLPVDAQRALSMGLVHEVYPDDTFEEKSLEFCRHLAKQNAEQMGTAKIAIEMAYDLDRAQGRQVERMANSTLMLHPDYLEGLERYVEKVGRSKQA